MKMERIKIKVLSVNVAYRGRRFATPELKAYKQILHLSFVKRKVPDGKLKVKYIFGVSSKRSDIDNMIKAFQDALSEFHGFDDNRIYALDVKKVDVKKGKEYVEFDIIGA